MTLNYSLTSAFFQYTLNIPPIHNHGLVSVIATGITAAPPVVGRRDVKAVADQDFSENAIKYKDLRMTAQCFPNRTTIITINIGPYPYPGIENVSFILGQHYLCVVE